MGRMEDQVCVVTVAARGIGKAIVDLFIQEGAKVVLVEQDHAGSELASALSERGSAALFVQTDVSRCIESYRCAKRCFQDFR